MAEYILTVILVIILLKKDLPFCSILKLCFILCHPPYPTPFLLKAVLNFSDAYTLLTQNTTLSFPQMVFWQNGEKRC